ncbi:hypothetical protein [Aquitalea denitrificans]|uniref:hypothetical protein n=1 Tax=Aquitalea denitrificans TaxID=519081 RepID=UPI001356F64B|nr:hypothetical protein [Aquitalea denitrificans]
MAKHLSLKDIDIFVQLIDAWEGKITWESLCEEGEKLVGFRPTRQTLNAHKKIKAAYLSRKENLKAGFTPSKRPASLAIAEQRIHRLENTNIRLEKENERLLIQFVRWQYNAYKHGMSKEMLDAPLPPIDRDSSEKP